MLHSAIARGFVIIALLTPLHASAATVTPVLLFEKSLSGGAQYEDAFISGGHDVDLDGLPDILFGSHNSTVGRVSIYSGADASLIDELLGRQGSGFFGSSVQFVGDLDGDGASDFVAAAAGEKSSYAYSGATRERLLPRAVLPWGGAVVPLGDADADGVPDFLVTSASGPDRLLAIAYSGRTGAVLYSTFDPAWGGNAIFWAAAIGDVDGDGVSDAVLGDPSEDGFAGVAWVVSGRTGALIRQHQGEAGERLGRWVAELHDLTGDGVPDYAIDETFHSGADGAPFHDAQGFAVGLGQVDGEGGNDVAVVTSTGFRLYDSAAARHLGAYDGFAASFHVLDMAPAGDLDGDGTPDLLIAGGHIGGSEAVLLAFRNLLGEPLEVAIDFMPRSCPNALSARGNGPIEVAILGRVGADVETIDLATVRLAGIAPRSLSTRVRDESTSVPGDDCACPPRGGDGIDDLILRFDAADLRAALAPVTIGEQRSLPFSARSSDGKAWFGTDCAAVSRRGPGAGTDVAQGAPTGLSALGSNVLATGELVRLTYPAPAGDGPARVSVFDVAGRHVTDLTDGATLDGRRTTTWNGLDARGSAVARGVYFVQARVVGENSRSVMIVVR